MRVKTIVKIIVGKINAYQQKNVVGTDFNYFLICYSKFSIIKYNIRNLRSEPPPNFSFLPDGMDADDEWRAMTEEENSLVQEEQSLKKEIEEVCELTFFSLHNLYLFILLIHFLFSRIFCGKIIYNSQFIFTI